MSKEKQEAFETFEFDLPPIRGFPELRWAGKRPFRSTQYFPAQKKEAYGDPTDGWWNRIYWGDNLQVMSHLLREFRGKIDLIYIDPPFDSKADYRKKISVKGKSAESDTLSFEEKQYTDIWVNDAYLQFMYERIVLLRDLLSDTGAIYLHCNAAKAHHLRCILDEVFGAANFRNEIIWCFKTSLRSSPRAFGKDHELILFYSKTERHTIHPDRADFPSSESTIKRWGPYADDTGFVSNKHFAGSASTIIDTEDETKGFNIFHGIPRDWWEISSNVAKGNSDEVSAGKYPTQKPEKLIERIIKASSRPGDLVLDTFMGSGTTQTVSMKLGRRFIGADINLGAIETTTKRLDSVRGEVDAESLLLPAAEDETRPTKFYTGFEVYNVNNYDLFRNPVEAKELIKEAMELQPLGSSGTFDGQRDEYLVKIMPVNRIATRSDLNELINGLDFKAFEARASKAPNRPVERIHLVCMGHEPDLGPELVKAAKPFDIDVIVTDLIRDKAHLHFKRASDARLKIEDGHLVIAGFYPMNLLQKLSSEADAVDWRQLVESIKIDWNYDGAVLTPAIVDAPEDDELVAGRYPIPADASTIRVKITDLLSESWEGDIANG